MGYDVECTADKCVGDLLEGELVITEFMANPASCNDNDCEWLELYNASGGSVDLYGLVLEDNAGRQDAITDSVVVVDGGLVLLGTGSADGWGHAEFTPDAHWGTSFILGNSGGSVSLQVTSTGLTVDATDYSSDAGASGFSWQLSPSASDSTSNDDAANWCLSTSPIGSSVDYGTPGQANAECSAK